MDTQLDVKGPDDLSKIQILRSMWVFWVMGELFGQLYGLGITAAWPFYVEK